MHKDSKLKYKKLIVFGGGTVVKGKNNNLYTKKTLKNYLYDLTHYFDRVIWMADHKEGSKSLAGELEIDCLTVIPLRPSKVAWPLHNWHVCNHAKGYNLLVFMPNSVRLYPSFGYLQRKANRIGVYLANDFQSYATESGYNRVPGGWRLYLNAHYRAIRMADVVLARGRKNANAALPYNDSVHETVPMGHMKLNKTPKQRTRQLGEDGYRLLYVGKIQWRKGMHELLHAFDVLCEKHPSLSFFLDLVGDGPDFKEVRALASELDTSERIYFSGWIDSTENLEEYWGRADALVMPSSKHKEGVPRVIDEALNRKIPVVATAIGGIPEEYTNGEVCLVEPGDAEELLGGLETVLFDEEVRDNQIKKGLSRIEQWRKYDSAGHQHGELLTH